MFAEVKDGMNVDVEAPEEYHELRNLNQNRERKAWKLRKALYGLRSSPMLWQCQLEKVLKDVGFYPDSQDPAVFLHEEGMMIVTNVDDFLIAGPGKKVTEVMERFRTNSK